MDFPAGTGKDPNLGYLICFCSGCEKAARLLICYLGVCKGLLVRKASSSHPQLRSSTHPSDGESSWGRGQRDLFPGQLGRARIPQGFEAVGWQQVSWLMWIVFGLNCKGHIRKMPSAWCS